MKAHMMKILVVLVVGFLLQDCSKNDAKPTEAQRVTSLMKTGTWKMQTTTVDGVDQSSLFKNFTLTFSDTGYTSSNGGVVWPASGTWKFVNDQATSFTRDDGMVVTIQDITSTSMTLSLAWTKTTLGPGRVASVKGLTVFTFGL